MAGLICQLAQHVLVCTCGLVSGLEKRRLSRVPTRWKEMQFPRSCRCIALLHIEDRGVFTVICLVGAGAHPNRLKQFKLTTQKIALSSQWKVIHVVACILHPKGHPWDILHYPARPSCTVQLCDVHFRKIFPPRFQYANVLCFGSPRQSFTSSWYE